MHGGVHLSECNKIWGGSKKILLHLHICIILVMEYIAQYHGNSYTKRLKLWYYWNIKFSFLNRSKIKSFPNSCIKDPCRKFHALVERNWTFWHFFPTQPNPSQLPMQSYLLLPHQPSMKIWWPTVTTTTAIISCSGLLSSFYYQNFCAFKILFIFGTGRTDTCKLPKNSQNEVEVDRTGRWWREDYNTQ